MTSPYICRLQNRLQHMYHEQPYARVDFNPMPESTLSPSQGLWIQPLIRNARANMLCQADVQWVFVMSLFRVSLIILFRVSLLTLFRIILPISFQMVQSVFINCVQSVPAHLVQNIPGAPCSEHPLLTLFRTSPAHLVLTISCSPSSEHPLLTLFRTSPAHLVLNIEKSTSHPAGHNAEE